MESPKTTKKKTKAQKLKEKQEKALKENRIVEHEFPLEEFVTQIDTGLYIINPSKSKGLTDEEAERRLTRDGLNQLTPIKTVPMWVKFFKQFIEFFPLLLEIGGVLCFIAYGLDRSTNDNLYLGVILWLVVILTAIFSFKQEAKSANIAAGLKKFAADTCKVIRNGNMKQMSSTLLVVGDIVYIKSGDRVPADIRVVQCVDFKVDNSSLTGESEPQSRSTECTDPSYLETKNLAFSSSLATDGECYGVVIRTGDKTVIGNISSLLAKTKGDDSPLKKEIATFIKIISAVALTLGLIFLIVGFAIKLKWVFVIVFVIGIVVANVPEGLLPTLTVALTLTAKRLSKKKVHVKNLDAVETLGSCSTIASDKTGTLTQNKMSVEHLWFNDEWFSSREGVSDPAFDREDHSFRYLHQIAVLCNRAVFEEVPRNHDNNDEVVVHVTERKVIGDASETALVQFGDKISPVERYRDQHPKLFEIPFNSKNKWQVSIHKLPEAEQEKGEMVLVMKGAPERVLDRCEFIMMNGVKIPMTETHRQQFQKAYERSAGFGERVLGFAHLHIENEKEKDEIVAKFQNPDEVQSITSLTFVGLISLMDPPKDGVKEAVSKCKIAGVRVIMVTGDHPLTAATIARQVGIFDSDKVDDVAAIRQQVSERGSISSGLINKKKRKTEQELVELPEWSVTDTIRHNDVIVRGSEIDDLTQEEWDAILDRHQIVFARTSPEQKLKIVEKCQLRGEIVAVTGDGVNDSPALKKSDLGCSMGISGSEVSKEAADVILLDDNFASIVNGIEEGRIVFDNLKKSIGYTLSSNFAELMPFIFFILFQVPLALSAVLILCIDIGTDMVTAISFAYEHPESDIMKRKPRKPTDRLVNAKLAIYAYAYMGLYQSISGFTSYFFVMSKVYGIPMRKLFFCGFNYFVLDTSQSAGDFHGYTPDEQIKILREAQTAFFVGVVVVRMAVGLVCKTRKISVFGKNLFQNKVFAAGIIIELLLALVLCYVPGIQTVFGTRSIGYEPWLISVGYACVVVALEELRKLAIRRFPHSRIKKIIYW